MSGAWAPSSSASSSGLHDQRLARRHVDDGFWLVGEELVDGLSGAVAAREAIVVADDDATRAHSRIEERQAVARGLVEVDVDMDERELAALDVWKAIWNPALVVVTVGKLRQVLARDALVDAQIAL